ncbi:DNA-J related domain-containing protein [Vibrio sp. 10N]|uniref:DNA-J related domain-containing protein n=1 Tax=Vibrio sp. 10N TaxID=3058938 RepID=UPI0028135ECB|nr:DNA-J related domain-containing protein [Vibrio sp. 10N]
MTELKSHQIHIQRQAENPLLWSVLNVFERQSESLQIHKLFSLLAEKDLIPTLDDSAEKDLFKRNFLLMNALYQLQDILIPEKWLQVEAMDIRLMPFNPSQHAVFSDDPLREYYLDWSHYEADNREVKRLLAEFWTRYQKHVGVQEVTMSQRQALDCFDLDETATQKEIRQAWRRLALKWHPDRVGGDSEKFRVYCEAWSILKE